MFWNPQATMPRDETEAGTKLCPYCAEEVQEQAMKCKHCLSWIGANWQRFTGPGPRGAGKPGSNLRRPLDDRKVFGVCGAIARSVGVDPTLVRVTYALASFFSAFVPGIIAYLIMTWAIPSEDSYV